MISLSNAVVFGWHSAIMGMRNPMNSWANSDSAFFSDFSCKIGQNDLIAVYDSENRELKEKIKELEQRND